MLSFGQSNYQDVVYLKNGSIIRGIIIEQIPNKSIKIETADRSVFVCQMDEIEKITKESYIDKNDNPIDNTGLQPGLQPGFKGIIELSYFSGVGDYSQNRFKLNFIFGYQLIPQFSIGFGTGLYNYFDNNATFLPVLMDFRVNFINSKVSPYLSFGFGYSWNKSNKFKEVGPLLTSAFGISFKISDKSAMFFGLGYDRQITDYYYTYMGNIRTRRVNLDAISFNAGISF